MLQRLYGLLRLQHNFFRPVRKLLSKRRVGSKVVKRYDTAQTPYQRVLATDVLTPVQRDTLTQQCQALDPIALARDIDRTLDVLWKLADDICRRDPLPGGRMRVLPARRTRVWSEEAGRHPRRSRSDGRRAASMR